MSIWPRIVARLHHAGSPKELHLRHPERLAEIQELTANEALLRRTDVIFTPHTGSTVLARCNGLMK
jgi:hypothetical protein